MRLPQIFKWRVRLVQKGYDLGYKHGYDMGKIDRQHEILDLLSHSIESIDWVEEGSIEVRDILPMIRNQSKPKVIDTWAEFADINSH